MAEGRPAGLTGKMEGGLDYDRSLDQVGTNTLKAEAHGNRGHGPLLSQVTGGRPGVMGNNVDPGASAVHQVGLPLSAPSHDRSSPPAAQQTGLGSSSSAQAGPPPFRLAAVYLAWLLSSTSTRLLQLHSESLGSLHTRHAGPCGLHISRASAWSSCSGAGGLLLSTTDQQAACTCATCNNQHTYTLFNCRLLCAI